MVRKHETTVEQTLKMICRDHLIKYVNDVPSTAIRIIQLKYAMNISSLMQSAHQAMT